MNYCKDCKYWYKHGWDRAIWGDCHQLKESNVFDLDIDCDEEGTHTVGIETHPDFGCVLWEGK